MNNKPISDKEWADFIDRFKNTQATSPDVFVQRPDGSFKKVSWSPLHRRLYRWWNSVVVLWLSLKYRGKPWR